MLHKQIYNRGPRMYPEKDGIIDGDRRFSYRECGERENRLANALLDMGLKKGDRLALVLKNCAEFIHALAAGSTTGVIISGINYRLNPDGIKGVLKDLQCRAIMVDREFKDIIESMRDELPFIEHYISVGFETPGMIEFEALISKYPAEEPDITIDESEPDIIMFTSGTTGLPKGVMLSRRVTFNRCFAQIVNQECYPYDRYLNAFPIFHTAVNNTLAYRYVGATNVLMRDFDPAEYCRLVEKEKINKAVLAPATLNMVLNSPASKKYDLSRIELMVYGGAPMPVDVLSRAIDLMPNCKFVSNLGSTEYTCSAAMLPEELMAAFRGGPEAQKRLLACGRAAILTEAKIVKEDGSEVKPGEIGEILLRGGNMFIGYLNRPEETAKAVRNGWLYTGDLATIDEENFIYIVDRKNHMIITGGENVYPAQVEEVLFTHPKIANAAVIGVPDDKWGEAVKAFVVLQPGETMTKEEVIEYCRPRMANYAKPKIVEFVDTLPTTATGKIDKLALKNQR